MPALSAEYYLICALEIHLPAEIGGGQPMADSLLQRRVQEVICQSSLQPLLLS